MTKPLSKNNKKPIICPITEGRPTVYNKDTFESLCRQKQAEKLGPHIINPQCQKCKGKVLPSELKIVEKSKIKKQTPESKICQNCEEEKINFTTKFDTKCCTTCATIISHAKYRPQALINALRITGSLPNPISVDEKNRSMKQIAERGAMINSLQSEPSESKNEVEQLKMELLELKATAESPIQLSKESTTETMRIALKISQEESEKVEEDNRNLKSENARLELVAANALEDARCLRVDNEHLHDKINQQVSNMNAYCNVAAKHRQRGDLGFYLLEGMASDAKLLMDVETIRKISGAVS